MTPTTLTVCTTCRAADRKALTEEPACGEAFLDEIERAHSGDGGVEIRPVQCLMGCDRACNVAVSAPGKMTYVLGRFVPGPEAAAAVLAYAALHAQSDTGVVPFRQWPPAVKGHFVARVPPV
ncbi:MAG: DUF1636 family protein [Paracoccaceae bacterium]